MNNDIFLFLVAHGCDISMLRGSPTNDIHDFPTYYWALNKEDSSTFIALCSDLFIPIIGGDILLGKGDGNLVFSDTHWYYDRRPNESFIDYLNHSINRAHEYLDLFSADPSLFFSFTTREFI